ncbi:nickel/cobalt transporter [Oleomonas cavernae]|nr:nickel/cobalt transporter [Oleomonas cavernae]
MSLALRRRPVGLVVLMALAAATVALAVLAPWPRLGGEIAALQRLLHGELVAALRGVKAHEAAALWTLIGVSFGYGIFHAAGPGHGKAVIATYLASNERRLRQGLILSAAASAVQGLTAIAITGVVVWLLQQTLHQAQETAMTVEKVSFALIGLLGLVLAYGGATGLWRRSAGQGHHHGHGHDHDHDEAPCHEPGCGHAHGPGPQDLAAPPSWRRSLAVIVSVGIRPCSGAILVLLFAHALDLPWAGIAAVAAMTLGTAITVAALASLAVYARRWSLAVLASRSGGGVLGQAADGIRLAGGVLVALLGFSLLIDAFTTLQQPPF